MTALWFYEKLCNIRNVIVINQQKPLSCERMMSDYGYLGLEVDWRKSELQRDEW